MSETQSISGAVVWITGLPSCGKSTLATALSARLRAQGRAACVLDGDEVRAALVPQPGYSDEERDAFYATLARLAALLAGQGLVAVVPATAHRAAYRAEARVLAPRFVEVHVDVDPAECARRDAKGLYAAAQQGAATSLPGRGVTYEAPASPEVVARGGQDDDALDAILARLP